MKTAHLLCISAMKKCDLFVLYLIFFGYKVHFARNFWEDEVETSREKVNCQTVTDNLKGGSITL